MADCNGDIHASLSITSPRMRPNHEVITCAL